MIHFKVILPNGDETVLSLTEVLKLIQEETGRQLVAELEEERVPE